MPRSAAAARSTWLVPMQKQPIASRSGRRVEHAGGDVGVGADAEQVDAGQRRRSAPPRRASRGAARPRSHAPRGSRRRPDGCSRAAAPSRSTSLGGRYRAADRAQNRSPTAARSPGRGPGMIRGMGRRRSAGWIAVPRRSLAGTAAARRPGRDRARCRRPAPKTGDGPPAPGRCRTSAPDGTSCPGPRRPPLPTDLRPPDDRRSGAGRHRHGHGRGRRPHRARPRSPRPEPPARRVSTSSSRVTALDEPGDDRRAAYDVPALRAAGPARHHHPARRPGDRRSVRRGHQRLRRSPAIQVPGMPQPIEMVGHVVEPAPAR